MIYTTGQKYGDTPEKSVFCLIFGTSVCHTEKSASERSITVFHISERELYFQPAPVLIFMKQTKVCVLLDFAHFWPNFKHISCSGGQAGVRLFRTAGLWYAVLLANLIHACSHMLDPLLPISRDFYEK